MSTAPDLLSRLSDNPHGRMSAEQIEEMRRRRLTIPSKMDQFRALKEGHTIRQGKIITAIPTQQTSVIPVQTSLPILGIQKEEKEIDYTKYIMGAVILGLGFFAYKKFL